MGPLCNCQVVARVGMWSVVLSMGRKHVVMKKAQRKGVRSDFTELLSVIMTMLW
jgi:hypothetical protein